MKKISSFLIAGLLVFSASATQAQFDISTNAAYVTGNGFIPDGFNPGSNPALQLLDNGVAPDVAAGDGIWSVRLTGAINIAGEYKVASTAPNFGVINVPNDNLKVNSGPTGTVDFFVNTNLTTANDGFSPSAGTSPTADGVVYSTYNKELVDGSDDGNIHMLGTFQAQRGGANFTAGAGAIVMSDVDNDDIYTATVTGLTPGSYTGKFTVGTAGFTKPDFGSQGLGGGGDVSFTVVNSTDNIEFSLNAITGRHKIANAAAVAGPPFYAQSNGWTTAFSAAEDMGAAVAGVYSRVFTVVTPGDYTARVSDTAGNRYPSSGNPATNFVPFTTTTANQQVRVVFDTNTYADGYSPADNFVIVTDATTRETLTTVGGVQFAGSFQVALNEGSFSVPNTNFQAINAGDGVWTYTAPVANFNNTNSPAEYKAVFGTTGQPANYTLQIGGGDDGFTTGGNNANVPGLTYAAGEFIHGKADARTGRIRMQASATSTNPIPSAQRNGAYLPAAADVENWMLHSY